MINQQLVDFIKKELQKGLNKEIISKELLANGWTTIDIEEGFTKVQNTVSNLSGVQISTPIVQSNISTFTTPNHFARKIFLLVIILFLLAGGTSAYFFRNELLTIPFVKKTLGVDIQLDSIPQGSTAAPETPVVNTTNTISYQTALDNFAKLTSFTFKGNESGKTALGLIPISFTGSVDISGNKCSLIRYMAVAPSKYNNYSNTFNAEDRFINENVYQLITGIGNTQINNKWAQLPLEKQDFSLLHLPFNLKDSNSVCKGQLPVISIFTPGSLLRQSATEVVYTLIPSADIEKMYSDTFAIKNIPGGQQTISGEFTIDMVTALPKKITITSSSFPDPIFTFEITATNTPVKIEIPTAFTSVAQSNLQDNQNQLISQLKHIMTIGYMGVNPASIFKLQGTYGVANSNGSCANPTSGSLFSKPLMPDINDNSSPKDREIFSDRSFFTSYVVDPIVRMKDMESYCYSDTKAYAIEIKIPGDTLYNCTDSTGFSKQTTKKITGPKCI